MNCLQMSQMSLELWARFPERKKLFAPMQPPQLQAVLIGCQRDARNRDIRGILGKFAKTMNFFSQIDENADI